MKELIFSLGKRKEEISIKLCVATSKPRIYAYRIIEHYDLRASFSLIMGAELDGRRSKKRELINYFENPQKQEYLMIGDRKHDIMGAKEAGIDSIGVLYGYGSEEEISNAGPTYAVKSVKELLDLLDRVI
jgi:phosphoglycolate phosphatase